MTTFKNCIAVGATAALALGLTVSAFAQSGTSGNTNTPRIDKRQVKQQQRIDQGVQSGQLTPTEQQHLENREARIAQNEAAAKADGRVTKKERARLTREENRTSHAIYYQKHDRQRVTTPAPAARGKRRG
jgi:uncharacterized membrane protein YebE (DUF533 family)